MSQGDSNDIASADHSLSGVMRGLVKLARWIVREMVRIGWWHPCAEERRRIEIPAKAELASADPRRTRPAGARALGGGAWYDSSLQMNEGVV
jgi:hypothetical protein